MTDEQKIAELSKLNKDQRNVLRGIWLSRGIHRITVEKLMSSNATRVMVCNEKNFWMVADIGPRGGIKSKKFEQL